MPLAFWRDEYCTGNSLVDDQHQHLFKIVNSLHEAMLAGHGRDVLRQTLRDLATYTLEHFKIEEQLMVTHAYPLYQEHKARHEELKVEVVALLKNFEETSYLAIEVSHFLTSWLVHHIKGEDQKMIRFMREKVDSQPMETLPYEPLPAATCILIEKLLAEKLSFEAIARITDVTPACLQNYIDTSRRNQVSDQRA